MTNHRREKTELTKATAQGYAPKLATWIAAMVIALVPFQGFLTVWGASLGANYTLLRLWDDIALAILFVLCAVWFWKDAELRERLKNSYVALVIAVFTLFQLLFALRGIMLGTVGLEAAALGFMLNVRGPLFLLCCLILVKYTAWPLSRWLRIAISSAVIVAAFAVLQFSVLPRDFLIHFGYGPTTILPYETINSNEAYIRVASTTRGVNPLGAYMAIMIPLLFALWAKLRPKVVGGLVVALLFGAMTVSFSRSAWLGCAMALLFLLILRLKTRKDWIWASGITVAVLLVATVVFGVVSKNVALQNIFLHTDNSSTIAEDSNNARYGAFFTTVREIVHDPLGRGVGSAGPASVHNSKAEARMAENYFLQITQETGWFGLFVYLAMLAVIGMQLWRLRDSKAVLGLLAAFIGTFVINMLSFAWTDDTLAFTWFGLAGLVIGTWMWRQDDAHGTIVE